MTPEEAKGLVAYANQIDPRVQANASTYEVWHYALARYPPAVAKTVVMKYYALTVSDDTGLPAITPGTIRRRIAAELERVQGQRTAVEATRQHRELTAAQPTPDAPPARAAGGPSRYQLALQQAQAATRMPD